MNTTQAKYNLYANGILHIENYNWAQPFSNFLPGIAGEIGIPMWVYYVNRSQAVCSFGTHDKDHAIMPFRSFNKACQSVGHRGFRTFIHVEDTHHEPFRKTTCTQIHQRMSISASELRLCEANSTNAVDVEVCYFTLPNCPLPGLVRRLKVKNRADQPRHFSIIDGLSRILPFGVRFEHSKVIARHIESMMGVTHMGGFPIFQLKQTTEDIESVGLLEAGHYYMHTLKPDQKLHTNIIVDPSILFGDSETSDHPWRLRQKGLDHILNLNQVTDSRTPCAFTAIETVLQAQESFQCDTITGAFSHIDKIANFMSIAIQPGFIDAKQRENQGIIEHIKNTTFTVSSKRLFDQYVQQTFLENVMRGGMPLDHGKSQDGPVFYSYHRQNGDLERDYHWFIIEPTFLSQGNSHYRNLLQNRRMDTWFFPMIKDHNLLFFMNLIQLDGYNPLEITGVKYQVTDVKKVRRLLSAWFTRSSTVETWLTWLSQPFSPGEFLMRLQCSYKNFERDWKKLLTNLLALCTQQEVGALHDGYWIDHWFYNLDLLESVLSIYPDQLQSFLIDKKAYSFFDSPDIVQPRDKKTVEVDGEIRQYQSVLREKQKEAFIKSRPEEQNKVRTHNGQGEVYKTSLLVKFLCIVANKLASLDPHGIGVEMEAGKPGWCDSLNGLPGLFGSSICETLELVRACRLLRDFVIKTNLTNSHHVRIFTELSQLMVGLLILLEKHEPDKESTPDCSFWDLSHSLREKYLETTRYGIAGTEDDWSIEKIKEFFDQCLNYLEKMLNPNQDKKRYHPSGVPYTYFVNPRARTNQGILPIRSEQRPLTPFLEGPVHYLRVYPEKAASLYAAVRNSDLFDVSLQMYRCCESLADEPFEIGRIKAYPEGWLENASIYTHMEYKWLLEILKSGLYQEFYRDMLSVLVPFHDPAQYGRSTFENCSFIVSSLFSDRSIHGQAYQPRLSGMTCELLHIWIWMTTGPQPFFQDANNHLRFRLRPKLPGWMFLKQGDTRQYWHQQAGWQTLDFPANSFAFKFMNQILVVYHNPHRVNTYEAHVKINRYDLSPRNGKLDTYLGDHLPAGVAAGIRQGVYDRIDAYFS